MRETRAALVVSRVPPSMREQECEGMQGWASEKIMIDQELLGIVGADGKTFEDHTGRHGRWTGVAYGGFERWTLALALASSG